VRNTVFVFCPRDNYDTCPRLKRTESPNAVRPYYLIDEDHPRGVVFLDGVELKSLPQGGLGSVRVFRENPDVLIVDAFGNRLRMSEEYFNQLCAAVESGVVFAALDGSMA